MNDVNIYSISSVKDLIRIRMDEFTYAIVLVIAISIFSFVTRMNFWALGILLGILLFSLIGFGFSASSIYKINRYGMQIDRFSMSTRKMNEAFSSAGGMEKFFYLLLALIWMISYVVSTVIKINILSNNSLLIIVVIELLFLIYVCKRIVSNLCFTIYYSAIVLGYLKVEYAKAEKRMMSNYDEVTDKLTRIKSKYINKVNKSLEEDDLTKKSQEEILIYQNFIREIDNVLVEILKL